MTTLNYKMNRKTKGTRTFFFPTVNGKRLSGTNYARKYDAKGFVRNLINKVGIEKIIELTA